MSDSVTDWLHAIEKTLPVATFRHGVTEQQAADERSEMATYDGSIGCANCEKAATRSYLLRGDVARWLDLCTPCAEWIKTGGQK